MKRYNVLLGLSTFQDTISFMLLGAAIALLIIKHSYVYSIYLSITAILLFFNSSKLMKEAVNIYNIEAKRILDEELKYIQEEIEKEREKQDDSGRSEDETPTAR